MKPNSPSATLLNRITRHRAFLPVTIFVVLVVVLLISTTLSDRPPVIGAITPQVGSPGSILVVKGNNFGKERGTSAVVVAGIRPPTSSYLEWTNTRISVRVPSEVDSGMVYVLRQNARSNGELFTNRNNIPVVVRTTSAPGEPHVTRIYPASGAVGTKLTITGENFGASRGSGKVLFTPISVSDQGVQVSDIGIQERFAGCACDYNYKSWNDKQIVLYVPNGASSGNVTVVTDRGTSNAHYFEVTTAVGTKAYRDKRGYQIHYGVQLSNVKSDSAGSIDLWLPNLSNTLAQRHIERIVEPKPMWGDFKGLMRFRLSGFKSSASYPVNVTYYFDRYALETRIDPTKVPHRYDTSRELYKVYTDTTALLPASDPQVQSTAKQVVGSEINPYMKARLLYNFVTEKLKYAATGDGQGVVTTLKARRGDSYTLSMVYTSLLRAVGIPARPVAGVLVYGDKKTVNHYWVEFYLPNFGWVPTDPALGAGARFGGFPNRSDAADYYFGNLDNQHITFTQGVVSVGQPDPKAKIVRRPRSYSLQSVSEDSSVGVKDYNSVWDDVTVVDWW